MRSIGETSGAPVKHPVNHLTLASVSMDSASPLRAPAVTSRPDWRITPGRLTLALTALALALRLVDIGTRPLWLDEAYSLWFSSQSFHYLWTVVPTYETHPPFFYSILKMWRLLVGDDHAGLRALSVLLGVLTVPIVMKIALEQERDEMPARPLLRAGLAGFLVACSPMFMVIDQEMRPYPFLAIAYSIAILALTRLSREFRRDSAGNWGSWALLGVGTTLTLWAHALGILYGFCLALALLPAWLAAPISRGRLLRGAVTAAAVVAFYLPCLLMLIGRTNDWGTTWIAWDSSMLLQLLVLYTVPVEVLTIGSAVAALAMALLIKRAFASTWASKGWNPDRQLLLLWLGPPLLSALISATFEPVFLARTLSATLVPAYLIMAGAAARSEGERDRRTVAAAICITLAPAALAVALRPAQERWDLLSAYLASNVTDKDQVWLYPADSALPLDALGQKVPGTVRSIPERYPTMGFKGPIRAGSPAVVSLTPRQAAQFANDPAINDVPVVWLVTRQSAVFDPRNDMPAALARVRAPGALQKWGYIALRPYYRR